MGVLTRAVLFLLDDFLERKRLKREGYMETASKFQDDVAVAESMKSGADRLAGQIEAAEALSDELKQLS